jgi:protein-tyrosine phosphatase
VPPTPDALSGAWNFRDIAEEAGIRPGRFFRSSELSGLDDSGQAALLGFGITDVADLRSEREVERRGQGRVPGGVVIHRLPFHELSKAGAEAPHEQSFQRIMTEKSDDEDAAAAAGRFMTEEYQNFPTLAGAQVAVLRVVSMLTEGRPVITHCYAGKDRTGFTVATVLEAVGVDRDAIMSDFLRSNAAVPRLRESILDSIRDRSEDTTDEIVTFAEARLTEEVLGVREVYLDTARKAIDDQYGSLEKYLEAVGVTSGQLDELRGALLD